MPQSRAQKGAGPRSQPSPSSRSPVDCTWGQNAGPPKHSRHASASPGSRLSFIDTSEAPASWKSPGSFSQSTGLDVDAFDSYNGTPGTTKPRKAIGSLTSSASFKGSPAMQLYSPAPRSAQAKPRGNFRRSSTCLSLHEGPYATATADFKSADLLREGSRLTVEFTDSDSSDAADWQVPKKKGVARGAEAQHQDSSSLDVSEVEGASQTQRPTAAVHEDLQLRILAERIRLLGSQRQLAAMRCAEFVKELESGLGQASTRGATAVAGGRADTCPVLASAPSSQDRIKTGVANPDSSSNDEEQYWSSPNFYRGPHRRYGPIAAVPPKSSLPVTGCRMPLDTFFCDKQKNKSKRAKKTPCRHTRRKLKQVLEHSDSD